MSKAYLPCPGCGNDTLSFSHIKGNIYESSQTCDCELTTAQIDALERDASEEDAN